MQQQAPQARVQQDEVVDLGKSTSSRRSRPRAPPPEASERSSSTAGSRQQTLANRIAGPGQVTGDIGSDGQYLFTVRRMSAPPYSRQNATVARAGSSKKRAVAAKAKGKGKKRSVNSDEDYEEDDEEKTKGKRSKKVPSEAPPAVTRSRAKMLGTPLQEPSK